MRPQLRSNCAEDLASRGRILIKRARDVDKGTATQAFRALETDGSTIQRLTWELGRDSRVHLGKAHREIWERVTEDPGGDSQGSLGETDRGAWERLRGELGRDSHGRLGETHRGAWGRFTRELGRDSQGNLGETHRGSLGETLELTEET